MDKTTSSPDGYDQELARVRAEVRRQVYLREGGRCLLCLRPMTDVHEIVQRSHHPRSRQLEAGTFSLANCVGLCRRCHQAVGQHKAAEWMFRVILHLRYGYERPYWYE